MIDAFTIKEWLLIGAAILILLNVALIVIQTKSHIVLNKAINDNRELIQILSHESELVHYIKEAKR